MAPAVTTAKRLLVAVHTNAAPWRDGPLAIANLVLKNQDNQTIHTERLLGSDDSPTGKCIGWQDLDETSFDGLKDLLLTTSPTVTISRSIGGQVEVLIEELNSEHRSVHGCQLMGDTHLLSPHSCTLRESRALDEDHAARLLRFLNEIPENIPERSGSFFREGCIYDSTGYQRVWNGLTYTLSHTQPHRVFHCRSITTDPAGQQVAFGFIEGTTSNPWIPDGLDSASWDSGWKARES